MSHICKSFNALILSRTQFQYQKVKISTSKYKKTKKSFSKLKTIQLKKQHINRKHDKNKSHPRV